jgi:hypothetical protein
MNNAEYGLLHQANFDPIPQHHYDRAATDERPFVAQTWGQPLAKLSKLAPSVAKHLELDQGIYYLTSKLFANNLKMVI